LKGKTYINLTKVIVEGVKRKVGGDENEWIRKTSGKAKGNV
jgi:hypothetical protein